MLFLSSLRLLTVAFLSQGDTVCGGCASWCLTKAGNWKTERGRLLYCKYAPVWSADVCLVTHPRWLLFSLPSIQLLFLCAQAQHPRTSLLFFLPLLGFLGYPSAFISMAKMLSPLWHLSLHHPKSGVVFQANVSNVDWNDSCGGGSSSPLLFVILIGLKGT